MSCGLFCLYGTYLLHSLLQGMAAFCNWAGARSVLHCILFMLNNVLCRARAAVFTPLGVQGKDGIGDRKKVELVLISYGKATNLGHLA